MGAPLHNTATLKHHNELRGSHGGETMSNDERRSAHKKVLERLADKSFALGVEGTSGFVKDEQIWLEEHRTGYADTLALATAEQSPAV